MVFAVESKVRTSTAGFKKLMKQLEEAMKTVVVSGVINGDADATEKAVLNEFGGTGIYEDGPYAGQSVVVPARSFVQAPVELNAEDIVNSGANDIDFDKKDGLINALRKMGRRASELQEKALESNGEGIPGWQKHNSPRTIETKEGLDKPLYTRNNTTFPIDYELQRRGA